MTWTSCDITQNQFDGCYSGYCHIIQNTWNTVWVFSEFNLNQNFCFSVKIINDSNQPDLHPLPPQYNVL